MIPSDHYVRFYNEVFKFLDERNELLPYYQEISRHQELHCLKLFQEKGLEGMLEYWSHIAVEENCLLDLEQKDGVLYTHMRKCPSLTKVLDNDAEPCRKYCEHCPGWVLPLFTKCGYYCVYDLIGMDIPQCRKFVTVDLGKARKIYQEWKKRYSSEYLRMNFMPHETAVVPENRTT